MSTLGILRQPKFRSPLGEQAVVRPKGGGTRRILTSSLLLTSLIDAFSILVIFLLMNASANTDTMEISKDMKLPKASTSAAFEAGPVLKIENGRYTLENVRVTRDQLTDKLSELHARLSKDSDKPVTQLIVQADSKEEFGALSPILLAGSETGFTQFKFAVLQGEDEK